MSCTVLSHTHRKAAHGLHTCGYCYQKIAKGEKYLDQRCADSGTAWTFRAHIDCHDAYWTWDDDDDGSHQLIDMTNGHLPPCPLAWATAEPGSTCACEVPA